MNETTFEKDTASSRFVFVACQPSAQQACKKELAQTHPELLPAFSRPGFLTFKCEKKMPDRFSLRSTFARTYGWSSQHIDGDQQLQSFVAEQIQKDSKFKNLHIWNRGWTDVQKAKDQEGEASVDAMVVALKKQNSKIAVNSVCDSDSKVLDVIRVDDRWMVGWHLAGTIHQRWPGGIPVLDTDAEKISRAYFKACEAILWSGANINKEDTCAEIGSAPGGCCQRLLELGCSVIAIDPADMHPKIANHKRLKHLKKRGREIQHKELSQASWLFADSNVAPTHTLDTVEALSRGEKTHFRGLILTLKCSKPELFDEIPSYIERVKSWGFKFVKTRHLAFGRQEVCLVAMKQKAVRRFRGGRSGAKPKATS